MSAPSVPASSISSVGMSFQHGKYVRALYADYEACLLRESLESSGFSPLYGLIRLMTLMRLPVTLPATLVVMLEFLIFGPGARKSNTMS